ncbi:MAG TPA: SDR family oxidoreductase [Terriglobales bacterium]|jgi:nucleoside-diphosphate-sugar epimerase|nr:SDR family oxidoreductase [Terriglobales bacterium]
MNVLFIGGTGIISSACARLAVRRGLNLTLLTRGQHAGATDGAETVTADINDASAVARALRGRRFDTVVNWIAFTPADIERDVELFRGRTGQYIFISSASAYQKPSTDYLITESTPLANPHWDYSRNKIACEDLLLKAYRDEGFPATIVRPSLTYGENLIPLVINSWQRSYTVVDRMLKGKKVIVPGDGSSLWVITHNSDFAKGFIGLVGHEQASGHAFHITTDEVLTWDQLYRTVAAAAGVEARIVHNPSDFMVACLPEMEGTLIGDKSVSVVFDNSKIKRFVPEFVATTRFAQGIRQSLDWFDADPARKLIDAEESAVWDKLIESYEKGLAEAAGRFR